MNKQFQPYEQPVISELIIEACSVLASSGNFGNENFSNDGDPIEF